MPTQCPCQRGIGRNKGTHWHLYFTHFQKSRWKKWRSHSAEPWADNYCCLRLAAATGNRNRLQADSDTANSTSSVTRTGCIHMAHWISLCHRQIWLLSWILLSLCNSEYQNTFSPVWQNSFLLGLLVSLTHPPICHWWQKPLLADCGDTIFFPFLQGKVCMWRCPISVQINTDFVHLLNPHLHLIPALPHFTFCLVTVNGAQIANSSSVADWISCYAWQQGDRPQQKSQSASR